MSAFTPSWFVTRSDIQAVQVSPCINIFYAMDTHLSNTFMLPMCTETALLTLILLVLLSVAATRLKVD